MDYVFTQPFYGYKLIKMLHKDMGTKFPYNNFSNKRLSHTLFHYLCYCFFNEKERSRAEVVNFLSVRRSS